MLTQEENGMNKKNICYQKKDIIIIIIIAWKYLKI